MQEAEKDDMLGKKAVLSEGDEFMAIKPWKSAIREPTGTQLRENK